MIRIEVPGKPLPLQRHRLGKNYIYDPSKKDKQEFAAYVADRIGKEYLCHKPIRVTLLYHMPIPRSYSLKKRLDTVNEFHGKRPDLSNLIKFTEDALQGILWNDDCLIDQIISCKFYSETPKTVIQLELLEEIEEEMVPILDISPYKPI